MALLERDNSSLWEFKGKIDYVDDWSLMRTPVPLLGIWLAYMVFVYKVGPSYMKGRPPFQMNNILVVYNTLQVLISCYLFIVGSNILWTYGLVQNKCITNSAEGERYLLHNFYYFFLAKITELTETIFFVLRKRYRQISFLHVYHHSSTVLFTWVIIKWDPAPIMIFIGTLNSFVHIVMYSYYALSAFPELNKYLWWKAYITKLQLIQFMIILFYMAMDFKYSECNVSYLIVGITVIDLILMIALFSNFYIQAYLKKDVKKSKGEQNRNKISEKKKFANEDCTYEEFKSNNTLNEEKIKNEIKKSRDFKNGTNEKKVL